jgi:hypothetical protein
MDGARFDTLACAFVVAGTRRRIVAVALAGALGLFGAQAEQTAAKNCRKIKDKKKRKKCLAKAKPCTPMCAGKICGDDGCGGICGVPCGANTVCQGGSCVCAFASCGGRCCRAGQVCLVNGSCAHSCTSTASCPCPDSDCAPSRETGMEGPKHCSLPTAAGACGPICTSTADCEQGRQCQSLGGFGICTLGQHCVPLCEG